MSDSSDEKQEISSPTNENSENSPSEYGTLRNIRLPTIKDHAHQALLTEDAFTYTPSNFIEAIGFGRAQIILLAIISLGFISEFGLIQSLPLLSTRLYVQMGLTEQLEAALGIASYSGIAISYPFWGYVADRVGRKNATLMAAIWVSFWSLLCCLAPDIYWLIAFRVLFSLGGGAFNLMLPYVYENLPRSYQWIGVLVTNQIGGGVGTQVAILLAYLVFTNDKNEIAWRYYLFILTVPVVIFIMLVLFFLDESPRYLMSKETDEKSLKVLNKLASRNKLVMPKQIRLVHDKELASSDDPTLSLWEKVKIVCKNWSIFRSVLSVVMLGLAGRFIFYGMSYVKTELIYMSGQKNSSDYCDGTSDKTYMLTGDDYLTLLWFQIGGDVFAALLFILVYKFNIGVKLTAFLSYIVCLVATGFLYSCPDIWVAIFLESVVYVMGTVISSASWLSLSGLLPTNIRTSMFGICTFIMYIPVPVSPYLIQVFSKESQHLVTTTCMVFISIGLTGSIIMPKEVYAN